MHSYPTYIYKRNFLMFAKLNEKIELRKWDDATRDFWSKLTNLVYCNRATK